MASISASAASPEASDVVVIDSQSTSSSPASPSASASASVCEHEHASPPTVSKLNALSNAPHGAATAATAVASTSADRSRNNRNNNNNNNNNNNYSNGNRNNINSSSTSKKKPEKGEETLLRLMEEARYEVEVDPYRGMRASNVTDRRDSPWHRSCRLNKSVNGNSNTDDVVELVTASKCPCLTQWSRDSKNAKLRQEYTFTNVSFEVCGIGLRPDDGASSFCCWPCDYNPYCLLTTGGGLINDVLFDEYLCEYDQEPIDYRDVKDLIHEACNETVFTKEELDYTSSTTSTTTTTTSTSKVVCIYRPETRTRLKSIRKSITVPEQMVRDHLQRTLKDLTKWPSPISVNQAIQILKQRHQRLIFDNPLKIRKKEEDDDDDAQEERHAANKLQLAVPPGIENLGCTCYLNTQLQCLAQCLVFLRGIFSWQPPNQDGTNNDRMHSVLRLFQKLMARMHAGHQATLSAVEFSNALGLDHFEQQDPNEFSRLFLDRMEESFVATSPIGNNNNNHNHNSDLKDLLSNLFQGKMCYEINCLSCGSRSKRYEDFKDLNLPIVQPSSAAAPSDSTKRKRKPIQQTLRDMFSSSASAPNEELQDTTVQACLDSYYTQPEVLEGENQYFCEKCQAKCDATRQLTFAKLPPILNIQLCRYVFDRASLTKKKLSDKVLLPLELFVTSQRQQRQPQQPEAPTTTTHRYVLCAVMRHQGNSAYSGHYVAEAMDWTTGQWFEFNDDKVTNLRDGPSCSYNPSFYPSSSSSSSHKNGGRSGNSYAATSGATNRKTGANSKSKTSISGSKDAYNLYYVEETFLAHSVFDNLREEFRANDANGTSSSSDHRTEELEPADSVIDCIAAERVAAYADLEGMCRQDGKQSRTRTKQRIYLRSEVFPELSSLELADGDEGVWVHREVLQRYLNLDFSQSIVPHITYLCSHETPGLHPRMARRGKLLPRKVFYALRRRNAAWYNSDSFSGADRSALEELDREGIVITPSSNMECRVCRDMYRDQLEAKLHTLESLKELFDLLDTKLHPEISLELKAGELPASGNEQFVYIISKAFVARFRRRFASLVKSLAAADNMCSLAESRGRVTDGTECIAEGIDALPTSSLDFQDNLNASGKDDDEIDPTVNGNIVCPHGRFTRNNKRLYRYVTYDTWTLVLNLFPRALMIRRKRTHRGETASATDTPEECCIDCEAAGLSEDQLRKRLDDLVLYCGNAEAYSSLEMNSVIKKECSLDISETLGEYRIVHEDDIAAWQNFLKSYRPNAKKGLATSLDSIMKQLLPSQDCKRRLCLSGNPDSNHDHSSLDDKLKLLELSSFLRPIVCEKHGKPIDEALFASETSRTASATGSAEGRKLRGRLAILDGKTYKEYITNLVALVLIATHSRVFDVGVDGENCKDDFLNLSFADVSLEAENFVERLKLTQIHPLFQRHVSSRPDSNQPKDMTTFCWSTDELGMMFDLFPSTCINPECGTTFRTWEDSEFRGKAESQSITAGSGASTAIVVDSDIEEVSGSFTLRVFEVAAGVDADEELSNLSLCAGLPTNECNNGNDNDQALRRSRRKRKTTYPVGAVLSEDSIRTNLHTNFAALRLALMEQCAAFELQHTLKLLVKGSWVLDQSVVTAGDVKEIGGQPSSPVQRKTMVPLSFSRNQMTLMEACIDAAVGSELQDFRPAEQVFLVRQAEIDPYSLDTNQEEIIDILMEMSNPKSDTSPMSESDRKRKRNGTRKAPERGFTGTLLAGGAPKQQADSSNNNNAQTRGTSPSDETSQLSTFTSKSELHEGGVSPSAKKRKKDKAAARGDEDVIHLTCESDDDQQKLSSSDVAKFESQRHSKPLNGKRSPAPVSGNSPTRVRHVLNDSSSDDSSVYELLSKPTFPPRNRQSKTTLSNTEPLQQEQSKDLLVAQLAHRLINAPGFQICYESESVQAAQWAVDSFPAEDRLDSLEDAAKRKFANMIELNGNSRH